MNKRPINVLLIEDDPDDAFFFEELLSENNRHAFKLFHVGMLQDGLDQLQNSHIDIVFLDLSLPDAQGLESFAQLNSEAPQLPVVVMSGLDDEIMAVNAVQAGAQDYLVKGQVSSNLLARSIQYAIERKRVRDALRRSHEDLERRVVERTAELARANQLLQQEVTERKRIEDALRDALHQLERRAAALEVANQELEQFAHVASHDLKAPLRAIASLSEWIEEDLEDVLTGDTRHNMYLLRGRVHRMEALINGILQYSRAGRGHAQVEHVSVRVLLVHIIDDLAPPDTFTIEISADMPTIMTERGKLEQVFTNLIGNAIKYHNRLDGVIRVTAANKEDFYEFSVADDGPGIDPKFHERIFVMFQTLQPRDEVESTGVGLAVVKKIVEEQGGMIRLESSAGNGSNFVFTWPKTPLQQDGE